MTSGTTRAVVLRVVDYRESDRIVTLFTEQHGKVSAMARAARRSQKRFAGGLESLCVVEVTLDPGRGELETLREARPVLPCLALLTSLPRIEAAGAGLELLRATLAERQPEPEVFALTVDFLLALDAGHPPATRLLQFQLDVLDLLGFSPELEQCGVCGKVAPEDRVALFRASA
ncbi:MAG: DNA repair protein RecO, partial [Deltaproteobacteria bacterium]|nr:DNA repair protein RecO [Deltaproteobacteria bacterium]